MNFAIRKNIFIEGDIKSGKSFILNNVLKRLNIKFGGFKTLPLYYEGKKIGFKLIDLMNYNEEIVALYNFDGNLIVNSYVFDDFGVKALENGLKNYDLIVMDELGFFEDNSEKFKEKVFEVLKSEKNVIAVIKKKKNDFLNRVSELGTIFKVENSNREKIIEEIIKEAKNWTFMKI